VCRTFGASERTAGEDKQPTEREEGKMVDDPSISIDRHAEQIPLRDRSAKPDTSPL
jgi:hypothetical protein